MKYIVAFVIMILISSCATGAKVTNLDPGMSSEQVIQTMGKPDGYQQRGEYKIFKYTNRLISGWSWDRTDYIFIFKDDKLVEYGAGQVRERHIDGIRSVFIYQM